MTTVKDLLVAARALIADEANWTRTAMARDAFGNEVTACDPEATCWCMNGALRKAAGIGKAEGCRIFSVPEAEIAWRLLNIASADSGGTPFYLNDFHKEGHAAVLRVYDAAIERA